MNAFRARLTFALCAAALAGAPAARAQGSLAEATAGSAAERYLRALQVAGEVPLYPWSLRAFSPAELRRLAPRDSAHPWAERLDARVRAAQALRPALDATWNSAFPYGRNDGAVWAGRGLTVSASAGAAAQAGPVSLRIEPVAFWAQNAGFELMPTGRTGERSFADPDNPDRIDLPQRFGDQAYARIDPGQSTLRIDVAGLAAGVSTASQQWGPAADQPLVLGPNAPGFVHVFAGTASPWNVGIGRVHGRMLWGPLSRSAYAAPDTLGMDRFAAALVGVFVPRGLPGLEVGVTRFFHIARADGPEFSDFLRPFEAFWKTGVAGEDDTRVENQLASAFFRWVLPRAGAEVYGEYARDDHNWDLLDFYLEPDHSASYLLGGQRAWRRGGALLAVRAEWLNSQASHLLQVRRQGRLYRHSELAEGHTHRGQVLGSPAGYGGGGSVVAFEAFTPRGRWSVDWTRTRLRDNWGQDGADEPRDDAMTDVLHTLGGEATWFRRRFDLTARLRAGYELNRHFRADAFNLTASFGLRMGL